jgi:hypothetical protein
MQRSIMTSLQPHSLTEVAQRLGWRERRRARRLQAELAVAVEAEADRLRMQTILSDARRLVEESWVRGAWFAIRDADGRIRFARGGATVQISDERIVGSCLVGAIVRAGGGMADAHEQSVQRALDAVWHALNEDEGEPVRWCPPPLVRMQHVRDLTRWNDRLAQGPGDVSDLLLTAERVALTSD